MRLPAHPGREMRPLLPLLTAAVLVLSGCARHGSPDSPASPEAGVVAEARAADGPTVASDCVLQVDVGAGWQDRGPVACPIDGVTRLLVFGDVGLAGPVLDASVATAQRVCEERGSCQIVLIPGDLIYGPGVVAQDAWKAIWDDAIARLGLPAIAVLGNHEYRHEPDPALKREAVFDSDGRAGLVIPSANFAVRYVSSDGTTHLAFAAVDTDTLLREEDAAPLHAAMASACAAGAPVITVAHHPGSSQGRHHAHEAGLEKQVRALLSSVDGCPVLAQVAGHDHDLQAWPPGCEEAGTPGVVVSGVAARSFRKAGPAHLSPCPATGEQGSYHSGPFDDRGGFALLTVQGSDVTVELFDTVQSEPLARHRWEATK